MPGFVEPCDPTLQERAPTGDGYESTEIGTYQQLGDEVVSCDVQGNECQSLLEYQALIKPFMQD